MVYLEGENDKVFSVFDKDPRDTLQLAETEAMLWLEAQLRNKRIGTQIITTP